MYYCYELTCMHALVTTEGHTLLTYYVHTPLLLLLLSGCCSSLSVSHRCPHFHGAWLCQMESFHSIRDNNLLAMNQTQQNPEWSFATLPCL